MPRIPEYTAPSPGITAPETGVEARGQAARRIGPFYHQMGQEYGGAIDTATKAAQEYVTHSQIAHGALGEAAILNKAETDWEKIKKDPNFDPNDPLVAQRFRTEQLEPALEKFNQGFTSPEAQKWALQRTEKIRDHFFEKTAADVSTISAIRAHNNADQVENLDTNTMVTAGDIGTAKRFIGDDKNPGILSDHLLSQMGPGMNAEEQEKYKANIQRAKERAVHAAASEAIARTAQNGGDPVAEKEKWQQNFPQYIKPEVEGALAREAVRQQKANALTERGLQEFGWKMAARAMTADMDKIYNDNAYEDPSNPGHILYKPGMTQQVLAAARKNEGAPGLQDHVDVMNKLVQQSLDKKYAVRDDPATMQKLANNMDPASPQHTTLLDIRRAKALNLLTPQKANEYEHLWDTMNLLPKNDATLNAALDSVKRQFTSSPSAFIKNIYGGDDYLKFLQVFTPEYLKQANAGTLKPGDLNLKDPDSMISKAREQAKPSAEEVLRRRSQRSGVEVPSTTMGPGNVPVYSGTAAGLGGSITGAPGETLVGTNAPPQWAFSPTANGGKGLVRSPDNTTYELSDPRIPENVRAEIKRKYNLGKSGKPAAPSPAPPAQLGPESVPQSR